MATLLFPIDNSFIIVISSKPGQSVPWGYEIRIRTDNGLITSVAYAEHSYYSDITFKYIPRVHVKYSNYIFQVLNGKIPKSVLENMINYFFNEYNCILEA